MMPQALCDWVALSGLVMIRDDRHGHHRIRDDLAHHRVRDDRHTWPPWGPPTGFVMIGMAHIGFVMIGTARAGARTGGQ